MEKDTGLDAEWSDLDEDMHVVLDDMPVGIKDILSTWKLSTGQLTHCMISMDGATSDSVTCASDNMVSRYCWVGGMDEKGSLPDDIRKVIYLLHMMQKWYDNQKFGPSMRAGDAPALIEKAEPFSSHTYIEHRSCFHKHIVDGVIASVPLFKIRLYVEQGIVKGDINKDKFFVFLTVDVPLTFDIVDALEKSCSRTGADKSICDEMKKMWVDIACAHRALGVYESTNKEDILNMNFKDLFDSESSYCFWKLFRIPICIRNVRRYLWIWGRSQRNEDESEKVGYINVKLVHIDKVLMGRCVKEYFDEAWAEISDLSCARMHESRTVYRAEQHAYNSRKQNAKRKHSGDDDAGMDDFGENDNEEMEEPVFSPPVIFSYPTKISFDDDATKNIMTQFAVRSANRDNAENIRLLRSHLETHEGSIEMRGFPQTDITICVKPSMMLPSGGTYVRYLDWVNENKGCDLPPDITRAILMAIYQRKASMNPSVSMLSAEINVLPRSVLTTEDLRRMLHCSDSQHRGKLLCNRSRYIYDRCKNSFIESAIGTQRVYAFSRYIDSTAIPLASATAKSDNGMNGGSDARVVVFNNVGEYCVPGSQTSFLYHIFAQTIDKVVKDFSSSEWHLNEAPDSLLHTLLLYNAALVNANHNYNLKGNNMQLLTMLMISDIGHSISYNESNFGMAKNGIGHTMHIKNFNGCIIRIDDNGTEDQNTTKRFGVGADNTINKYVEAQDPRNNCVPSDIDVNAYTSIDNLVGASGMGLWYAYTELYTRLKRMNTITTVPPLVYCTELPVSDNKMQSASDPGGTMYGKFATLMARQTDTATGSKRSFTSKNETTQSTESATQEQLCYIRVLAFCHNEDARGDPKRHTVEAVITPIPSAGVDVDEPATDDSDMIDSTTNQAADDMGDSGRFVGTKNNPAVTRTHPFFFSVQGLAQVVVSMQRIGLLNAFSDGFEGSIMNLLSNVVYMNRSWMTLKASCPSSRGRQNEKVQSRMPAMSILMHATNTFLHPSIAVMSWADIVSVTTLNWSSNPCPSVLYPNFLSQLIANTFDWSIWLVLMVFVDYFDVPDIALDVVDELFSSDFTNKPPIRADKTAKILKWIETLGLNAAGDSQGHEVVYQAESEPLVSRTAVYVTNKWSADDSASTSATPLVVNIERGGNSGNSTYGNKEKTSGNMKTTAAWKMAEAVASKMFAKYKKHLISACNIDSMLDFTAMIYRNTNRLLHYPKFGGIPCGAGFQSFNNVLKGLGSGLQNAAVYGQLNSDTYVDGNHASVYKHLQTNRSSYEIAPITIINREGSVWSMCLEIRFLILVKGLLGPRPTVSQMSIQGIFDNLVAWTVRGRLPSTIYCENMFMSTHPDNLGSGLNIVDVSYNKQRKRPYTMIRPIPNQAIEEKSPHVLPGIVDGQLPEDFLIVGHLRRIAERVSDNSLKVQYSDVHLEMLSIPSLPSDMWIPIQFVQKNISEQYCAAQVEFDAGKAPYKNAAFYLDGATKKITVLVAALPTHPGEELSLLECKKLHTEYNTHGKAQGFLASTVQCPDVTVSKHNTSRAVLFPDKDQFVRYLPTFNRPGILVKIPNSMFYSTMVQWPIGAILRKPQVPISCNTFYNPCSMTYLLKTEQLEEASCPSTLWPKDDELPEFVHDDVRDSIFTDIGGIYMSICSTLVQEYIIPVGTILYIDIEHAAVPAYLKSGLVCTQVLSKTEHKEFEDLGTKKMKKEIFMSTFGETHRIQGLLECMLIYELPESVLRVDSSKVPDPVWVSVVVKTARNSREKRSIRHLVVPTRAIIDIDRLHTLGILPVICQKYN